MYQTNILRPTKQRLFKRKFYGFDVETYDNNTKVYLISLYGENLSKTFYNVNDFFDFIILNFRTFKGAWIFATNLHFDFFSCVWGNGKLIDKFVWQLRGGSSGLMFAKTFICDGSLSAKRKDKNSKSVTFVDTMNYDLISVEKMGNLLGISKLEKPRCVIENDCPKNNEEWKNMIEYNMRDSEITYKYMRFLINGFEELGASLKITLAGTSMSLFRSKYLDRNIFRHDENVLMEQMQGYYGGRTEAFSRGDLKVYIKNNNVDKCFRFDINSMYPFVMKEYEYPDPNSLRTTTNGKIEYIMDYHGMSYVDIFCPYMKYPLLPFKNKKGFTVFATGRFSGWYTHVELRKAIELGYKIEYIHKTYYYLRNMRPFVKFVLDLYSLRMKYKAEKDSRQQVIKILMNSLYGKFGQRFYDREKIIHFNQITIDELSKYPDFERIGDFFRIFHIKGDPAPFCIPIWASYITAYSRILIQDALVKYNGVYCDTDCIITTEMIPNSSELGAFKLEIKIKGGIICRSKFYSIEGEAGDKEVKLKGCGRKLGFEEFMYLMEKDPVVFYKKFAKIKESMRRGIIPNTILPVSKKFSLEDEKHTWESTFDYKEWQESKPLNICEVKPLL